MKIVFADTSYFVALLNPRDAHHSFAIERASSLGTFRLVTSEMVLTELLTFFAREGQVFRARAVELCDRLGEDPNVEIEPQTRDLFRRALERYRAMKDKNWSVTDCASFHLMEREGIRDALTNDHHFEQAGFRALLRKA